MCGNGQTPHFLRSMFVSAMSIRERFPICPLCGELVELSTAATNEDGKAVHEDCYAKAIASSKAKPSPDIERSA